MRLRTTLVLSACIVACGCGSEKTTADLLNDLKGSSERDRISAVRTLPQRQDDAAEVIAALTETLKDADADMRMAAASGLGAFGEQAKAAIPLLQQMAKNDHDHRVRKVVGIALTKIDPSTTSKNTAKSGQ